MVALLVSTGWFARPSVNAQQSQAPSPLTAADYARAERFMTYNTTPLVLHSAGRATWVADGSAERFWYRTTTERVPKRSWSIAADGAKSACDLPACRRRRCETAAAAAAGAPPRVDARSPDGKRDGVHPRLESVGPRHRDRQGDAADERRREGFRLRHRQRRLDAQRPPDSRLVARLEEDRDVPAGPARVGEMYLVDTRSDIRRCRRGSIRCPATPTSR